MHNSSKSKRSVYYCSKEVIICAGCIESPKILELSGIGGKDLLARHHIDLVYDNPAVGANLQDHVFFPAVFLSKENKDLGTTPAHVDKDPVRLLKEFAK